MRNGIPCTSMTSLRVMTGKDLVYLRPAAAGSVQTLLTAQLTAGAARHGLHF